MCIFPEGSRFTKEKHEASKEFCRSRGLQPLKHHLYPRTKGFAYAVKNMHYSKNSVSKYSNITFITVCTKNILYCLVEAVYDVTLGFKKGEPSILGVMNADPCEIDILVRYTQDETHKLLKNQPIVYYALEN